MLVTNQDRKVVVRQVDSAVALRLQGSAEEDQVLRDGRVQDDHGAHCSAGVVEEPVVRRPVLHCIAILCSQVLRDLAEQRLGVVAVD